MLENENAVLNERGYPKAVVPDVPGLYFVGYRNPPTGLLRSIGIDARRVAQAIVESADG